MNCVNVKKILISVSYCSSPLNPNTFRKLVIDVPPDLVDMYVYFVVLIVADGGIHNSMSNLLL